MNSQTTLSLIAFILAFTLFCCAGVSTNAIYATGGLDDEEEEEAIEQLQNAIEEIQGTLGTLQLNLTAGANDIQANCPSIEEVVEEVVENITNSNNNNNNNNETTTPAEEEQQPTCPIVEQKEELSQQQPPTTLLPNIIAEPEEQNETQQGCQVVPDEPAPVEQNETTSDLEPIICPINGELLGYTNTTSGEQLPISAGKNQTVPFLPFIELPNEEAEQAPVEEAVENNQTAPTTEEPAAELPTCNITSPTTEEPEQPPSIVQGQQQGNATDPVEFDLNCGCFVVDKSPQEVQ